MTARSRRAALRRALSVLALSAAAWPLALQAQAPGPPVEPGHWSYDFLEALDVAGVASSWMYDVRPVALSTVADELRRVTDEGFGREEGAPALVEAWSRRLDQEEGGHLRLEAGDRDGAAFLDPGTGAYADLRLTADLGGRATLWGEGATGGWRVSDGFRAGGVSANLGPFVVTAARRRLKGAGPGDASALLGPAVPLDALTVVSRRPSPLPYLDWLFGPMAWSFSLAPWDGDLSTAGGWVGTGGAVAQPTAHLRVGATRSARFARGDSPGFTPGRFLRMVFLIENQPTSWDDQKLSLWARYRWSLFGQGLASWVVVAQEDSPLYLDPGLMVGTKAARITGSGLWELSWEYRAYGMRGQWCFWCEATHDGRTESGRAEGQWYQHAPEGAYARDGLPMGDALGGYGAQHRVELEHWSRGGAWRGRVWAFFQVRDDPRNVLYDRWPGKRRGVGVEGAWYPGGDVEFGATLLEAGGPRIEREWGGRAWVAWTAGGGGGGR